LQTQLGNNLFDAITKEKQLRITEPVSFLDMIQLEKNAALILTDSGGVQKEAYFFQKPCIILLPETEWVEVTAQGTAIIADTEITQIIHSFQQLFLNQNLKYPPLFGDGHAAQFICNEMLNAFSNNCPTWYL